MKLYLTNRFFYIAMAVVGWVVLSYSYGWMYLPSVIAAGVLVLVSLAELIWVRILSAGVDVKRIVTTQWSMGDRQYVDYNLSNQSNTDLKIDLVDELPIQLQYRDSIISTTLASQTTANHRHEMRPTERGEYPFGNMHMFLSIPWLSLIQLRKTWQAEVNTAVYPSFIQMKNMEMQVFSKTATLAGIRKVREIGENDEFEQIRDYVVGDNVKSINWRATSRSGKLMINQYQNSKSQMVYCIVDKGRSMKMPFDELTLLDYAINTTLVTSNIVLRKYDKIGLITFSNKIGAVINADAQKGQLQKITKALYDQKTNFSESDFRLIYHTIRQRIRRRSILLLFTNFEHHQDMKRQLPYLRSLSKNHLLVVIFFTNAEMETATQADPKTMDELYFRTFAQESIMNKERMVSELQRNGIQVILSTPNELSVNTINKYLEIKSKRMK